MQRCGSTDGVLEFHKTNFGGLGINLHILWRYA